MPSSAVPSGHCAFVNDVQFGQDIDVSACDFTGHGQIFLGGLNVA